MVRLGLDTNRSPRDTNSMPLSDTQLRSLKPESKPRKLSDFEGLFLLVNPSGSRLWRFSYRFGGKQKLLALGAYPAVSLREARRAKDDARELLAKGMDPAHERKVAKARKRMAAANTFEAVANEWFDARKDGWVPSYSDRLKARLDADLIPYLGRRPIAEIEPVELLSTIRSIEGRGAPEMARRVLQMASAIFRYGVALGVCPRDPAADLRGALKSAPPAKRRSAILPKDLSQFMQDLAVYNGAAQTKLALELLIHRGEAPPAGRPGETTGVLVRLASPSENGGGEHFNRRAGTPIGSGAVRGWTKRLCLEGAMPRALVVRTVWRFRRS